MMNSMNSMNRHYAQKFFSHTRLLLLLSIAALLMTGVKFLAADPLERGLPYHIIAPFSHIMLNLTIMTGLLGGGIYAFMKADANDTVLKMGYWLWTGFLILAGLAGLTGITDGRHMLELPVVLDGLQAIALLVVLAAVLMNMDSWSATATVWSLGIALSAICGVLGLLPTENYLQDRVWRLLAVGLNVNLAYVWAALGLGFWLMQGFSTPINPPVYLFAGLLTIANTLVVLSPFALFGTSSGSLFLSMAVMAVYGALGLYAYHALSRRNTTATLAGHWYALAIILYVLGIGLLGGAQVSPDVIQWTQGTRLTDLQFSLTAFGTLAIVLGVINQLTTGGRYAFWLVAAGMMIGAIFLGGAGLVQTYTERMLSIGYLDVQNLLVPLYIVWLAGLLLMAIGIGLSIERKFRL